RGVLQRLLTLKRLLGVLWSRLLLLRIRLSGSKRLSISEHRLAVDVLSKQFQAGETSIGICENQPKILSSNWILKGTPHETQAVGGKKLIDGVGIHTELPPILLDRPRVLAAAKDQFFLHVPLRLHLVHGVSRCDKNGCRSQKENQGG